MKYASAGARWALSHAPRYAAANRRAVAEMVRQAGPLRTGRDGLARRGVLVRHLVLPGGARRHPRRARLARRSTRASR